MNRSEPTLFASSTVVNVLAHTAYGAIIGAFAGLAG